MADFDIRDRYVDITLNGNQTQVIRGLYQYDKGLKLRVYGQPTNAFYSMQYGSIGGKGETVDAVSTVENGVVVAQIPDSLLMLPRDMVCYIYVPHSNYGFTTYEIMMPLIRRIMPSSYAMSQDQIDTYMDLIEQANLQISQANALNNSSQSINTRLQTQLDKWQNSSFYVNTTDGNLYMEV